LGYDGADGREPRIAFISSNSAWGGSEELWSAAAAVLARRGARVTVGKAGIDGELERIATLEALGVPLVDLRRIPLVPDRLISLLVKFSWPFDYVIRLLRLHRFLRRSRPDLVVLSQGGNLDGLFYAKRLRHAGVPYVLIVQKAAEMYWPSDDQLSEMQASYVAAQKVYFVSSHNLRLTELQLARPLPNAEVVRNPFLVPHDQPQPWPASDLPLRLACVGRLFPREKGQDIVLRVLARGKWRDRPIEVTFFGAGLHVEALRQSAAFLGLNNVTFAGFSGDVAAIWRDHHALLLPSHCEGLPLVLVEAMLSGRVPIVSDVAGNAEVVTDDITGFLAASPTERSLDEALERSWQARARWPEMGAAAAREIRKLVPPSPEMSFADRLLGLLRHCQSERTVR
jgi:glycosyltransferase involved in cell wall biosynthesis